MPNRIATLPSNPEPLKDVDRSEWDYQRRWKLTISSKTEVYLSEKEKDYFVEQIANGKKIIRVGEMILTNKFFCIVPVGESYRRNESDGVYYYSKSQPLTPQEREKSLKALQRIRGELSKVLGFK